MDGEASQSHQPRTMPLGPAPRLDSNGNRIVKDTKKLLDPSPFMVQGHPPDGLIDPQGNPRHVFEKRETPLCFMQPYYNPIVFGTKKDDAVPGTGDGKVFNGFHRITPALRAYRGEEVLAHGDRRIKDVRKLGTEFKSRIKEAADREKAAEAEKNKTRARLRWWHTRQSVELRDLLKTMKFNNYTFKPEALLNAKDVVILNLTGCRLGDEAMQWVSTFMVQNGTLRRLILQGNKLTAEGIENLREGIRKNGTLTDIDLSLNPIGDAGVNALVSCMSEGRRTTKISTVNVSTCELTPSSGYHIARLIRDFKTIEVIYAWRNRLGAPTNSDLAGVGLILDAMAETKTLKHIDLSANNLSEEALANHATVMEQQKRQQRLNDIKKKHRRDRIAALTKQITEMKAEELWEDEKVILAGFERELANEKRQYQLDQEEDARLRKLKTKDFEWVERVHKLTGRELADPTVQVRLVLFGNHSVSPMTVSRLSQFYDLNSKDDTQDWIHRVRKYDRMLRPRRNVGEEYRQRTWEEAQEEGVDGVWEFEADMRRIEEEARAERARELDEMRKQGIVASDVLEERLRGRTPNRKDRTGTAHSGSTRSRPDDLSSRGDGAATATASDAPLSPRERDRQELSTRSRPGAMLGEELKSRGRSRAARSRSGRNRGQASPRDESVGFHSAISEDLALTPDDGAATDHSALDSDAVVEQSDSELFSDASVNVKVRREGNQRRANRRVRARAGDGSGVQVGMSTSTRRAGRRGESGAFGGNESGFAVTVGGDDSDDDVFGDRNRPGAAGGDIDAFDDDVFNDDEGAADEGPMGELMRQLVPRAEENTARGMQRKLAERMEEVKERINAKHHEVRRRASVVLDPAAMAAAAAAASGEQAARPGDDEDGEGNEASVTVTANQDGELLISVKQGEEEQQKVIAPATSGDADDDGDGAAAAQSVELPKEVAPDVVATTLVTDGISTLKSLWENIQALSEIGSPTEDDLELLNAEKEKATNFKRSLARSIAALPQPAKIESEAKKELVVSAVEELVRETDRAPGATELLRAIVGGVDLDWPSIVEDRALGASCAVDGSTDMLAVLLEIPDVRFDVVELVCSCFFNQAMRIPLTYQLLTAPQPLPLADWAEDLQEQWQEFFEDVASAKRAIPREDREKRLELLELMLAFDTFTIDAETEAGDGQTLFSRACVEGDLDVVQMLVNAGKVTDVNAVRTDGMTALHSAVIGNNADLVKFVMQSGDRIGGEPDVNAEGPNGNPLDLAVMLQRDPKIAAALKSAGAKGTSKSAGKKPKPKGKGGIAVGAAAAKLAARTRRR
eukprot:CAMPEP_0174829806 /NCGR_PEP_ID=MMETSP1114-20130205/2152_1 /TAXON_ID=312471 /ORGANISM="Neobodo designis, Strain CCAP 1951/1" /LENGTH=1311 /DNA_ID=CAMNT_0016063571 /DNA_START=174 /DNA_END=4109 /DNA_ORIENTATION=+